jgi:hypothetical protein
VLHDASALVGQADAMGSAVALRAADRAFR